jgi:hypothetical protein
MDSSHKVEMGCGQQSQRIDGMWTAITEDRWDVTVNKEER